MVIQVFHRYKPNCGKKPYLAIWKIFKKILRCGSGCGWVPKFNPFFLDHRHIVVKFSWRSDHFFSRNMRPNCGKIPHLAMLQNPSKISTFGSRGGWLPTFNHSLFVCKDISVVKYSWRSDQWFLGEVDRQTDKQTDKRLVKHLRTS